MATPTNGVAAKLLAFQNVSESSESINLRLNNPTIDTSFPAEPSPDSAPDEVTAGPSLLTVAGQRELRELPTKADAPSRLTSTKTYKYPLLSIKTNALYDLVLMPNIELEYYFADRWSLSGEYQIAWWNFSSNDQFYQIQTGGPELRCWLRPDRKFTGHYFGMYGSVGIYDLKNGNVGYRSNGLWSAGISWGYVKSIKKNFLIEFGVGMGYVFTRYDEYERNTGLDKHYDYIRTRQTSYFGPTKLKVGLVWRLGKTVKAK